MHYESVWREGRVCVRVRGEGRGICVGVRGKCKGMCTRYQGVGSCA